MILDLDFPILKLNREPFKDDKDQIVYAYQFLSTALSQKYDGFNSTKAMLLALKLYEDKKIDLDKADLEALEKGLPSAAFVNFIDAPILAAIKKAIANCD